MPVLISLLRGVNLGGHHLVKMDQLRAMYEELGFSSVRTYVQSGNVVFRARERTQARLSARIEEAIEARWGFRPKVMIRSPDDLRTVIAENPFAERDGIVPGFLTVVFLADRPDADASQRVAALNGGPEELYLRGCELYIYYPNGMGKSKLSHGPLERALKIPGTARNWNTVTSLLAIADEISAQTRNPGTSAAAKRNST